MNPFIQNHKLALIRVYETTNLVNTNDITDGIILNYQRVTNEFCAEQQSKISVYDIPFIENILFKEITSKGRDLLLYIIYNIKQNEDSINLKIDSISKKILMSKPTLLKAIKELEEIAIICRKSQSEYWINPFYIFKGNRIKYYQKECPDCIEIKAEVNKKDK